MNLRWVRPTHRVMVHWTFTGSCRYTNLSLEISSQLEDDNPRAAAERQGSLLPDVCLRNLMTRSRLLNIYGVPPEHRPSRSKVRCGLILGLEKAEKLSMYLLYTPSYWHDWPALPECCIWPTAAPSPILISRHIILRIFGWTGI